MTTPTLPVPTLEDIFQELSGSTQQRQGIFGRALASNPFITRSPLARQVAERQFDPFNAQFLAQAGRNLLGGQTSVPSFRDFIGGGGGNLMNNLRTLGAGAFPAEFASSGAPPVGGFTAPDPIAAANARSFLSDPNVAQDLIFQSALQGASPVLRGAITQGLADRIAQFLEPDPTRNLFGAFVNRGFRF